ncbi:unnamed protein product [Phaeothamnion confervicola]
MLARSAAGLESRSPLKKVEHGLPRAIALAKQEQELEDINVERKYDRKIDRILFVMPMTEQFDPPVGTPSHGHVQTGDKASIPKSILAEIMRQSLEVPWQFEITRVERTGPGRYEPVDWETPTAEVLRGVKEMPPLPRAFCSMLDYRSPEQYLFLPDWLMKSLRLRPRDTVRFRFLRLSMGGTVVLQPHTSAFAKLTNSQAVLEMELKHYSCLTKGTTISFNYRGERYDFNVVDCLDTDKKSVPAVNVQDSDVITDFIPALDSPEARKHKAAMLAKAAAAEAESAAAAAAAAGKAAGAANGAGAGSRSGGGDNGSSDGESSEEEL